MLFSATWRQKSQKIDFMNVFHGFIGFGSETANIFNTCMAQGAYIVQYIVNSCRGCWQYTISIVAGIKNHIKRDPYVRSAFWRSLLDVQLNAFLRPFHATQRCRIASSTSVWQFRSVFCASASQMSLLASSMSSSLTSQRRAI